MTESTVLSIFSAISGRGAGSPAWMTRAACRSENALVFFSFDSETAKERAGREARAKEICETCPVRAECLAYALREDESYGVWGGLGENERKALRRRRAN
ncbi:MAG: WhiB family transcriptional regulator [Actinomycetota bacterium]